MTIGQGGRSVKEVEGGRASGMRRGDEESMRSDKQNDGMNGRMKMGDESYV